MISNSVYSCRDQKNWYEIIAEDPTNSTKEIHHDCLGKLNITINLLRNEPLYKPEIPHC